MRRVEAGWLVVAYVRGVYKAPTHRPLKILGESYSDGVAGGG